MQEDKQEINSPFYHGKQAIDKFVDAVANLKSNPWSEDEGSILEESSLSINFCDTEELEFPIPNSLKRLPNNEPTVTGTVYE
jgi:hypothetical protein